MVQVCAGSRQFCGIRVSTRKAELQVRICFCSRVFWLKGKGELMGAVAGGVRKKKNEACAPPSITRLINKKENIGN